MKTLRETIAEATSRQVAVGHFNISNIEGFWAIVRAAKELNLPVIIGVSEGERDFIGVRQVAALVKSYREETGQTVFLNADHTYSFERVKEAIDAGFDSVIFDGAQLPLEENIQTAKQCVEYAKNCGREVLIEGELGYIGTSSKVLTEIPAGVDLSTGNLTHPDEAAKLVSESGVNMLAPAVGNIHGMLAVGADPKLNIKRVGEIAAAVKIPLVLHGASGNSDEDIQAAIKSGVGIVHINTELRVAFRDALKFSLQENLDEVAPYKIMKGSVTAMQKVAEKKLRLFNNL
jgi:fructose-bisphosphate aldolase class II